MKLCLGIISLLFLVTGTFSQGFDLADAFDDIEPTPAKPKELPKAPEKPGDGDFGLDLSDALGPDPKPEPDKPVVKPPKSGGDDFGLDLSDAFGPDDKPTVKPPAKPPKSGGDDFGLDLSDALGPDPNPKPDKPAVKPPKGGGGGGSFDDADLFDIGGGGDYKPEGGRPGGGGRASDPGYDPHGGADQPQAEAGSGPIAGIVSAVGVALLGAASSYFAYQKKKLCFKLQGGGADIESGKGQHGNQSDPQVMSDLLRSS
ncbi:uncharacterized protein V6R79_018275 [Siganus canaliculatus]